MASWSCSEIRTVLRYNFVRGLSIDQCLEEMTPALNNDCPHRTTIFRWYREFQRGNFTLEEDRRVTYRQIEETLYLHAPAIHSILCDHLQVKKLYYLWVPHSSRVTWCRKMPKMFDKGQSQHVNSIVTGDETWLYYYDVPTKAQNKV
ncbi:hypothetical protein ILUMI_05976 [Ignelater luminosus]|uniref:Mos1 transposase HTH domain-containing protein n=1 Tax=Ignelater luminosus TaxID=2038154 RepID=A0A8K0GD21_IGNLU|nr:hypothetical protein ILUMI_05976 [Ignelater luminosus]